MSDNVILLGAGASYNAGIPLLGTFMERMIEIALTGRVGKEKLTAVDQKIFTTAMLIRDKLENYHARVSVDQFNLEQILSVLSFESFAGTSGSKKDLELFTKAIARTIELTCKVRHNGKTNEIQEDGDSVYLAFWYALFKLRQNRMVAMPSILSFNYDLVFERALFQSLIGHKRAEFWSKLNVSGISIDYHNPDIGKLNYRIKSGQWPGKSFERLHGYFLEPLEGEVPEGFINIPFMKLHGSLNFPVKKGPGPFSAVTALEDSKIIPPVFNKADSTFTSSIWKAALESLRGCKNLIVCGYSLPTTDTYMQYFLKAALGPNKHLNRIYVFDPDLYNGSEKGETLKARYKSCFSEALRDRIVYQPNPSAKTSSRGTFEDFVHMLSNDPDSLLFGLEPAVAGVSEHFA